MLSFLIGCGKKEDELKEKDDNTVAELPDELTKAIKYIDSNYHKLLSLEKISSEAGVDKFYFSHLFRRYTGITVMQYVCGVRIENAIRLLGTTDMSVEQTAQVSGFANYINMERAFKQKYGITPIRFRKQL